jgi:phosphoenolpyruvate synthase/pyruvate phosphate dikinase
MGQPRDIVEISRADRIDIEFIGKKAFELGELRYLGIPIPKGFVITTNYFEKFLLETGISKDLENTVKIYHPSLKNSIDKLFLPIKKKIMQTHIPQDLSSEFHKFYRELAGEFKEAAVNIYLSSKTDESLSFPNIKGDTNIILKIKEIWAAHFLNPSAIIIMENINSEIKENTSTNNPIADKRMTEKQAEKLFEYCKLIQSSLYFPKMIEYVVSHEKIYVINLAPFTNSVMDNMQKPIMREKKTRMALLKGTPINSGIATGPIRILDPLRINSTLKIGEIAITPKMNSSLYKEIENAKAVIIESLLPDPQSKFYYRKHVRIPTIEGVKNATKIFQNGNIITVNGMNGEIYSGGLIY